MQVQPEHVRNLGELHALLLDLNDPYASTESLTPHIAQIPLLRARCIDRATSQAFGRQFDTLEQVMMVLGNRGLEAVLLELLEDMTIAKGEFDAAAERAQASPPAVEKPDVAPASAGTPAPVAPEKPSAPRPSSPWARRKPGP
jgi:hypothetical protein